MVEELVLTWITGIYRGRLLYVLLGGALFLLQPTTDAQSRSSTMLTDASRLPIKADQAFVVLKCASKQYYQLPAVLAQPRFIEDQQGSPSIQPVTGLAAGGLEQIGMCKPKWYVPVYVSSHANSDKRFFVSDKYMWTSETAQFGEMRAAELQKIIQSQSLIAGRLREELAVEMSRLQALKDELSKTLFQNDSAGSSSLSKRLTWERNILERHLQALKQTEQRVQSDSSSIQLRSELTNQLGELAAAAKLAEERASTQTKRIRRDIPPKEESLVDLERLEAEVAQLQARRQTLQQRGQGGVSSRGTRTLEEEYLLR
jgi:hypothetical protein